MESYIILQDKHATTSRRAVVTALIRAAAAAAVTAGLTLAMLPPADVVTVQRALAVTTIPSASGELAGQA